MRDFVLSKDEKVLKEIKPSTNLKRYLLITYFLFSLAIVHIYAIPLILGITAANDVDGSVILMIIFIYFLISLLITKLLANAAYNKYYYWITNKRIISKKGIIGYKVVSTSIKRIADVTFSNTFLESISGITSLRIQSIGSSQKVEGALYGVTNPEQISKLISDLIEQNP